MKVLGEIHHKPGLRLQGRTITREAVRGIIAEGNRLLLVFSANVGDYKFPGGGMLPGENHAAALQREIAEELGAEAITIGLPFGTMIEYDQPVEADFDLFMMTSHYYWCKMEASLGKQRLDDYEADLGFTPLWVEIADAIRQNRALLADPSRHTPRWVRRELFILERIAALLQESQP
jgi:8-oxo-dGTP pyrophosphatase MutT (NUDIX family)